MAEVDVNGSDWDCTLFREADILVREAGERDGAEHGGGGDRSVVVPSPGATPPMAGNEAAAAPSIACGGHLPPLLSATQGRIHPRHAARAGAIRGDHAIRLGFRQVKGLRKDDMHRLVARRGTGYDSVRDLWLRAELSPAVLERLAEADAFRSLGLDRREALWIVRGLNRAGDKDDLPLLRALSLDESEPDAHLPSMPLGQHVVEDYRHLTLSLKAHPVAFVRARLGGALRAEELATHPVDRRVTVAGLVLVRQRPGSAKGTIFLTLEDETGVSNIIVWPKIFEQVRATVIGGRFIAVTGRLQRDGDVIHVVAERAEDLTRLLGLLSREGGAVSSLARADHVRRPLLPPRERRCAKTAPPQPGLFELLPAAAEEAASLRHVLPKGRNFQ